MKRRTPNGWWNQRSQQRQGMTVSDYLLNIHLAAQARLHWFQELLMSWNYFKMLAGRLRRPAKTIATLTEAASVLAAAATAKAASV